MGICRLEEVRCKAGLFGKEAIGPCKDRLSAFARSVETENGNARAIIRKGMRAEDVRGTMRCPFLNVSDKASA